MVIDSLEFARRQGTLSGRLELGALPRLAEVLFDVSGSLGFEVAGEAARDETFLILSIEGSLQLICQRCLGALAFALNVRSRVMLVGPGAPWPEDGQVGGLEDETCDAIEASRELDVTPLLEEEILLALPIVPRHDRCELPVSAEISKEASPFAKLARFKCN